MTPILEKSPERDLHEAEHVDWYDLVGVTPGMPLISLLGHAAAVGPQGESCQILKYIEKHSIGITAHRIQLNTSDTLVFKYTYKQNQRTRSNTKYYTIDKTPEKWPKYGWVSLGGPKLLKSNVFTAYLTIILG